MLQGCLRVRLRHLRACLIVLHSGCKVYICDLCHYLWKLVPLLWGHHHEVHSHPTHWAAGNYFCTYIQEDASEGKSKLSFSANRQGVHCFDVATHATYVLHRPPSPAFPALDDEYLGGTLARVARKTTAFYKAIICNSHNCSLSWTI